MGRSGRERPVELLEVPGMNPGAARKFLEYRAAAAARIELGIKPERPGDSDLALEVCGSRVAIEAEMVQRVLGEVYSLPRIV